MRRGMKRLVPHATVVAAAAMLVAVALAVPAFGGGARAKSRTAPHLSGWPRPARVETPDQEG